MDIKELKKEFYGKFVCTDIHQPEFAVSPDKVWEWMEEKINCVELPLIATNQKIKDAIKEILWMARRYADGRQTFAATSFNDAYDLLRNEFGEDIEYNNINEWKDQTLTEEGKYFPYAQDGGGQIFDCVSGRKYYQGSQD